MRNNYQNCQLADIINALHKDIPEIAPNSWKARTLYALMRCRTAEMGGHIDRCDNDECNKLHISYNSCRNRHCPRCQGHLREKWIQNREKDLLNTSYFHSLSRIGILPKGFTRIRHYGILASAFKAAHKVNIDSQIGQVVVEVEKKTASLLNRCPSCKTGELHTVASFEQRAPPANWFNKIKKQNNKRQVA